MLEILGVIFIIIICRFIYSLSKQSSQVKKEGGMRIKYNKIVDHVLGSHNDAKIFQESSNDIVVGVSNYAGSTIFRLTQTFGTVTIEYEVQNQIFGKQNLEWQFDENMSQTLMLERMERDCSRMIENQNF